MSVLRGTFPAATNAAQHSLARHFSFPAVVGYLNTEFGRDMSTFKAAPFITIGITDSDGDDCVRLSDLKVGGYGDECVENVWIDVLNKNGSIKQTEGMDTQYKWCTVDFDHEVEGWYDPEGNPLSDDASPFGNAEDITFKVGEGICFNVDVGFENAYLSCNGQVLQAASRFVIPCDMQSIAANPLARRISLSEITVSNYGDECVEGVWIDILNKNGSIKQTEGIDTQYKWCTVDFDHEVEGWYDPEGNPLADDASPLGNADEIFFEIGDGICINADGDFVGAYINFPSL